MSAIAAEGGLANLLADAVSWTVSRTTQRLYPLQVARTEGERRAIFRMRYPIYLGERGVVAHREADDPTGELHTPEDDLPDATLYYIGTPEKMLGSMRVRVWEAGRVPEDVRARYGFSGFPTLDERPTCQVTFLCAVPSFRGTSAVAAMTSAGIDRTVRQHRVEAMFAECSPGLVRAYERLGLRSYGGAPISAPDGMLIPVVGIVGDLRHVRAVRSPWYPTLRQLANDGAMSPREFDSLLGGLRPQTAVELRPEVVSARVEACARQHPEGFLARLSPAARRALCHRAAIIPVPAGARVIEQGTGSRDMFVVLEGGAEVHVGGAGVARLDPGDVFGELAAVRSSPRRTASVFASTDSRLLHLRTGVLRGLRKSAPAHAAEIYATLAGIIADKLHATNERRGDARDR